MKFSLSLYQRLALSLTLFVLILITVLFYLSNNIQKQTKLKAEQTLHYDLAKHLVEDNQHLANGNFDYTTLKDLFHTQMLLGPAFEFYFLDPAGHVLSYAVPKESVLLKKIDIDPITDFIEKKESLPLFSQDPRSTSAKKIFSASPIYNQNALLGYLYIIIGGQQYDESYLKTNEQNAYSKELYLFVGAIIALLMFLLVLFYFFTRPLNKIKNYADQIWLDTPNFDASNKKNWPQDFNEIHQLGRSVNEMTRRLQNQYSMLEKIDSQRKTMLAGLSHDLRTPLASLRGYLETLNLQKEIDIKEQSQFLEVALKNANQLTLLIDQLFELAYLEGGQIKLNKENVNLEELLGDIVAKFYLKAKDKKIEFKLEASNDRLEVFTDIGKFERVISNIIDNAIRHTPENGQIILSINCTATAESKTCTLGVKDSGVGIAEDEIGQIFDARFQASNSVTNENKNVGLGLAISKNLIDLLSGKIDVNSKLGEGCEFIIEMPVE